MNRPTKKRGYIFPRTVRPQNLDLKKKIPRSVRSKNFLNIFFQGPYVIKLILNKIWSLKHAFFVNIGQRTSRPQIMDFLKHIFKDH